MSLETCATPSSSVSGTSKAFPRTSGRQKKQKTDSDSILKVVGERLQNCRQEDAFDIVGRNIAEKLRQLEPTMRIYAEKVINDALFEAQLGTLTRYAHIVCTQYGNESIQNNSNSSGNNQVYHDLQNRSMGPPNTLTGQFFSNWEPH